MDKIQHANINSNFGNFHNQNNQNSKNLSQDSKNSKEKQNFLDTIQQILKEQKEELNNDNEINSTTTQILTPTYPNGRGNGENNRFDRQLQGQSENIKEDRRSDSTTYNGSTAKLFSEKDERSQSFDERSRILGYGSQGIRRIYQQEAKLTADELESLKKLQRKQALKAYREPYKEQLLSTIENNLQDIINNPNDNLNISSIKKIDKLLTIFKQHFPKTQYSISKIEKDFLPLKEKYLPKQTKEISCKSKRKNNNYEIEM